MITTLIRTPSHRDMVVITVISNSTPMDGGSYRALSGIRLAWCPIIYEKKSFDYA